MWGDWRYWVVDDTHQYVTGGQVRFEGGQGRDDDTAMNGIAFKFTPLKVLKTFHFDYDMSQMSLTTAPTEALSTTFLND